MSRTAHTLLRRLAMLAALFFSGFVSAQSYPSKAIRVIVPSAAGGSPGRSFR